MTPKPNDDIVLLADWQRAKEICSNSSTEDACRIGANAAFQKVNEIDLDLGCEWTRKPQNYDALTQRIGFKGINIKANPVCHAKVLPESGHSTDIKVAKTEFDYGKIAASKPRK